MKHKIHSTFKVTAFAAALLLGGVHSFAAGLLKPKDASIPAMQIREHHVKVILNNGFAMTEVNQTFFNPNDRDLEAVYTFPLPARAGLSEFSMWIDGKEVMGEVVEAKKAREIYENEKAQGREAGITEKDDYKTFDTAVYPVRAQQETRIRIVYYQPLEIDTGIGRYVYPLEEGGVDEVRKAFWSLNPSVENHFSLELVLKNAYPVLDVRAPGYESAARVEQIDPGRWKVTLDKPEGHKLTKDFLLYYSLDPSRPARVEMIPFRDDPNKPGSFMMVMTPGADLKEITEGTDWTFVLDISGSMTSKIFSEVEGVGRVLTGMNPDDRYRIILFDDGARDLTGGYIKAHPENVNKTLAQLAAVQANGSTNLYAGIKKALFGLEKDRTSGVVLVTDGVANVGPTTHDAFLKLMENYDVRLFTFVMGNSANRPLLEKLAKESNGFAKNISNADDIIGQVILAKGKISHEAMHDVRVDFDGIKVFDLSPAEIGSIYRGQQVVLFGKYAEAGTAGVTLRARISGKPVEYDTLVDFPHIEESCPEIERLRALARIEDVMETIREEGEDDELRNAVVDLGTEYSLVTDYTSMVVMRENRFKDYGIDRKNRGRVERERQARQTRADSGPVNRRVDKKNPMFKLPAPNIGGGAVDPVGGSLVILLGGLGLGSALRRRK